MPFWMLVNQADKKDQRSYRLVTTNAKGDLGPIVEFTSEFSRKPIALNQQVYDLTGKLAGFVSVFGYDHKAPKALQGDQPTAFDVVYLDYQGNLKWKTTIHHGDEKHYKHVILPMQCYTNENKLVFLNFKQAGLKASYEVLQIDKDGHKEIIDHELKDKPFGYENPVDFIYQANQTGATESNIWTIKAKGEGIYPEPTVYSQLYVSQLYKNSFYPKTNKVFKIQPSIHRPQFTLLDTQDGTELKYLVTVGPQYYILTLSTHEVSTIVQLKSDLFNIAAAEPTFSFSATNTPLIDQQNRIAYLVHQIYTQTGDNFTELNKLLITKVSY